MGKFSPENWAFESNDSKVYGDQRNFKTFRISDPTHLPWKEFVEYWFSDRMYRKDSTDRLGAEKTLSSCRRQKK